jgi:putative ABC transport system substrate-binding protein
LDFRFWIGEKSMNKISWMRWLDSLSGNRKSKTCPFDKLRAGSELCRRIQNRKWLRLVAIVLALALSGAAVEAQQPKKTPLLGLLATGSPGSYAREIDSFRQGLRELGYVEGKNISIEYRYAEGMVDALPGLAQELVRLKVDIIVTSSGAAIRATKNATKTIPIVFATAADPVGAGIVASLAKPGGNVTGMVLLAPELNGKRLELLKEAFPKVTRVAFLWSVIGSSGSRFKEAEAVAKALGLRLHSMVFKGADDLASAFDIAKKAGAQAFTTTPVPGLVTYRARIIDLAAQKRLPAIYESSGWVEAGGLMSYGPDSLGQWHRAATYVDKILKGRTPADLPVEQPMRFEFVINLKAAKQIGVTIPPNVLVRADRVIR